MEERVLEKKLRESFRGLPNFDLGDYLNFVKEHNANPDDPAIQKEYMLRKKNGQDRLENSESDDAKKKVYVSPKDGSLWPSEEAYQTFLEHETKQASQPLPKPKLDNQSPILKRENSIEHKEDHRPIERERNMFNAQPKVDIKDTKMSQVQSFSKELEKKDSIGILQKVMKSNGVHETKEAYRASLEKTSADLLNIIKELVDLQKEIQNEIDSL